MLLAQTSGLTEQMLLYAAGSMFSAIEFLHSFGIVYRNVNPENLFIDASGRIVFIDNRFAKIGGVGSKSYTVCGSVDFLSPEQITQAGHGAEVDLWALGVALYEIAVGEHPFNASNEVAIFTKITSYGSAGYSKLTFPPDVPAQLQSLISQLVLKDPSARLGANGNYTKVKSHKYFEGIDWNLIVQPSYVSPLKDIISAEIAGTSSSTLDPDRYASWNSEYSGDLTSLWEL
jgi:serine/threonine protein kinase